MESELPQVSPIPPIVGRQPPVATELGPLPAERALAFNQSELLLHGPAHCRPGHQFTSGELAGYGKTAARILLLLEAHPWAGLPLPIRWESPEVLVFQCLHMDLLFDLLILAGSTTRKGQQAGMLQQLERIEFLGDALRFRRC